MSCLYGGNLQLVDDGLDIKRLQALRQNLGKRSRMLRCIRDFFSGEGFFEIQTPVRVAAPALELHIDAERSGEKYLRTSPELYMKRLLAAGFSSVFEMGSCFRKGETGRFHRPEYTMLEWYRLSADYQKILSDCRELLQFVAKFFDCQKLEYQGISVDLMSPWEVITIKDAFEEFAGWNPVGGYDADRFNMDLIEKVEPALPKNVPVVLKDYPAEEAALARLKPDCPAVAERWELYVCGIELANAFTELTDREEQEKRFKEVARARSERSKDIYPVDSQFLSALASGLPECGGAALGVDRLLMLFCNARDIRDVGIYV